MADKTMMMMKLKLKKLWCSSGLIYRFLMKGKFKPRASPMILLELECKIIIENYHEVYDEGRTREEI